MSNTILAGVSGTTAMTIYSYALSAMKDKNFKEPSLLGSLFLRGIPSAEKKQSKILGWGMHYLVGIGFSILYRTILMHKKPGYPPKGSVMAGGISGIIAVAVWHSAFSIHPNPPKNNRMRYYGQLVVAHIIFSTVTISVLKALDRTSASSQKHLFKSHSKITS